MCTVANLVVCVCVCVCVQDAFELLQESQVRRGTELQLLPVCCP